jgi:acyl dehydratase
MDHEARSRGLSEAILPALRHTEMASARLEEMVWHRPVLPGNPLDVLEQAARLASEPPTDSAQGRVSMSRRMDALLSTGTLVEPN